MAPVGPFATWYLGVGAESKKSANDSATRCHIKGCMLYHIGSLSHMVGWRGGVLSMLGAEPYWFNVINASIY